MPSAAEKTGDFSAGNFGTIYDPKTYNPATNTRESFADEYGNGNKIPAGSIDPIAQAFVNLYPAANVPGKLKNNYTITVGAPYDLQQGDFRGDFAPSAKDQGFFRFSDAGFTSNRGQIFPGIAQGQSGSADQFESILGASLGETHIFSTNLVNTARLGFSWYGDGQRDSAFRNSFPSRPI